MYLVRGELRTAYGIAERLLRRAQSVPDPALLLLAHYALARISHQDLKRAGDQEKSCRDRFLARSERRCEQLCVGRQRFQGCYQGLSRIVSKLLPRRTGSL